MLKVQDKPFTNVEDITKINMVTQNVVVCTSLSAGINFCGHSADWVHFGARLICLYTCSTSGVVLELTCTVVL